MKVSILVVDDEQYIRDMLVRHFKYLGYSIDSAENGKEAIIKLEDKKYDIVISDIMMPLMNGVELVKYIRYNHPMIRCIMITGFVTMDNVLSCMREGVSTCIFKPMDDLSELENAVEKAVNDLQHWLNILKELRGLKA